MTLTLKARVSTLAILVASTASLGSPLDASKKIDFELTGTVIDADTKLPIEGAYVVATYKTLKSDMAATKSSCLKTKGMYTAADGRYHFPVEKLDGRSPFATNAIKQGYVLKDRQLPDPLVWKKQDAPAYRGRDIYLVKQDPSDPRWRFSDNQEVCEEASTREAAAAGVQFLKIDLSERKRYGSRDQGIPALERMIQRLSELPSETTVK